MNENNSGTRGLGDGVMKVDLSDPAVAEAHTVSFALFWGGMKPMLMREHLEQDLRSSPECVHKNGGNGKVQQIRAGWFGGGFSRGAEGSWDDLDLGERTRTSVGHQHRRAYK